MKNFYYWYFLLLITINTSCNSFFSNIEINGEATGVKDGAVQIKDLHHKTVFEAVINNGKFSIPKQLLPAPGFYKIHFREGDLVKMGMMDKDMEIYLEPGSYTIKTDQANLNQYPVITSTSKTQLQLSHYYPFADSLTQVLMSTIPRSSQAIADTSLSKVELFERNVAQATARLNEVKAQVLEAFISKYPDDEIIAHIMANINYDAEPMIYNRVYQKFGSAAKNSEDGKIIGNNLKHLIQLMPGALAPALAGKTPDGQSVDLKSLHKKIILIDFWRSDVMITRVGHQQLVSKIIPQINNPGFGIISVSLDTKRDWWLPTIKDDKMTWSQISDLQGFDSPNVDNWGIQTLPAYCLIDGTGHILGRNLPISFIAEKVSDYLAKH